MSDSAPGITRISGARTSSLSLRLLALAAVTVASLIGSIGFPNGKLANFVNGVYPISEKYATQAGRDEAKPEVAAVALETA